MAASAITASIGQLLLLILGIVLYIIGVAYLNSVIPNSDFSGSSIPDVIQQIIFWGACLCMTLLQYSNRKITHARIVLLGSGAAIALVVTATPYSLLQVRSYPPVPPNEQLAQFALDVRAAREAATPLPENQKEVYIQLPLRISGLATGHVVQQKGMQVTIEDASGVAWKSHWIAAYSVLWPGQERVAIDFPIARKLFEQVKSTPVKLHVAIALAEYRQTDERSAVASSGFFPVAQFGACSIYMGSSTFLDCRSPFGTPGFIATVSQATATCPPKGTPGDVRIGRFAIARGGDWNDSSPVQFS